LFLSFGCHCCLTGLCESFFLLCHFTPSISFLQFSLW
jgi:hypothetical protein